MMKTIDLNGYLARVKARKAKLASDDEVLAVERCRNKGTRRTASKQAALQRAEGRARAAGLPSITANY